jgi:hypothetical protein
VNFYAREFLRNNLQILCSRCNSAKGNDVAQCVLFNEP